jgi:hypothetical protein
MIDNLTNVERVLYRTCVRLDHVFQSWCFEFLRHQPLGHYALRGWVRMVFRGECA